MATLFSDQGAVGAGIWSLSCEGGGAPASDAEACQPRKQVLCAGSKRVKAQPPRLVCACPSLGTRNLQLCSGPTHLCLGFLETKKPAPP